MNVTAIIPAFNERRTIAYVLTALLHTPQVAEIIVVDDGSTDGTEPYIREYFPSVRYFRHGTNLGKGAALSTGAQHATHDILLFCDADLIGFTPRHVAQLLMPLGSHCRLVCGVQEFLNPFQKQSKGRSYDTNQSSFQEFLKGLGGEKILYRVDFLQYVHRAPSGYGIEHDLLSYYHERRLPVRYVVLAGVRHRHKIWKWGLVKGLKKEFGAYDTFAKQFFRKYRDTRRSPAARA